VSFDRGSSCPVVSVLPIWVEVVLFCAGSAASPGVVHFATAMPITALPANDASAVHDHLRTMTESP